MVHLVFRNDELISIFASMTEARMEIVKWEKEEPFNNFRIESWVVGCPHERYWS